MKMLILSGSLGDGHKQAANALREASRLYPSEVEVETLVVDFMEWTHPHLHSLGRYLYIQGVRKFPSVYGYLFQKTRRPNSLSDVLKRLKWFGLSRTIRLIENFQPDVIVSTFPVAAAAISNLKGHGLTTIPSVTVITDHTDHSYWVHNHTDQYIVGSGRVRESLIRLGVPEAKIAVTGIPIRPDFCRAYDRNVLFEKYGLQSDLPTILVMGGGFGMIGSGLVDLMQSDVLSSPLQFIIVCGHNEKLKSQLTAALAESKHRIMITGFIDHVHELMAISDLIITKPGGLTTSEAIALELPMLLYKPLPGQEQDNAAYLLQAGLAMQADNEGDLFAKLTEAMEDSRMLAAMRMKAKQMQGKRAAYQALDTILHTRTS